MPGNRPTIRDHTLLPVDAGAAWHDGPVAYTEALPLARLLTTACLITISYLSGVSIRRPGG